MPFITTICICGTGTMGSGIAQIATQSGFSVIKFDKDDKMLLKSKTSIESILQKLVEKSKIDIDEKAAIAQRIVYTSLINECIASLIIEAVIEDKEVKQLFDELALINNDETIFATNTSSISIADLSNNKSYASRFAGLHFFMNIKPLNS